MITRICWEQKAYLDSKLMAKLSQMQSEKLGHQESIVKMKDM